MHMQKKLAIISCDRRETKKNSQTFLLLFKEEYPSSRGGGGFRLFLFNRNFVRTNEFENHTVSF